MFNNKNNAKRRNTLLSYSVYSGFSITRITQGVNFPLTKITHCVRFPSNNHFGLHKYCNFLESLRFPLDAACYSCYSSMPRTYSITKITHRVNFPVTRITHRVILYAGGARYAGVPAAPSGTRRSASTRFDSLGPLRGETSSRQRHDTLRCVSCVMCHTSCDV